MTIPEVQTRLRAAFPQSADAPLLRAVQEGSFLADHLFDGESFLDNPVGRDLRGHVRRIGIAHQIHTYCTRGDLPFATTMKPMPKGRWHWLEICSTGALAHVCRTEDVFSFPDEADSRQDMRLTLQGDLFSWMGKQKPLSEVVKEVPQLYAWLTFRVGHDGRISHLCWASPAADCDRWVGHINILEQLAKSAPTDFKPTTLDPKAKLRLKDHVVEALEKSGAKLASE